MSVYLRLCLLSNKRPPNCLLHPHHRSFLSIILKSSSLPPTSSSTTPFKNIHTCSLWLPLFTSLFVYIKLQINQSKKKKTKKNEKKNSKNLAILFMISLYFYFRFKVFATKNQNLTDNPNFGIQTKQCA